MWILLALGLGGLIYAMTQGAPQQPARAPRDARIDPQAAAAFEAALANNTNSQELRQLAAGALTLGSAIYARALLRKALAVEGVPPEQLEEQTDQQLALGNITRPPPRQGQPAPDSPTTPGGPRA